MFKELAPYLRQRAVLLTVTYLEDDQIRVNIIPQKIKDGENSALTTPLSVTGTAEELDRELPSTIVSFVSAHLQLKNTLERARAEMDTAAKVATAAVTTKKKATGEKKQPPYPDTTAKADAAPKPATPMSPEALKAPSLFGDPEPEVRAAVSALSAEENDGLAAARESSEERNEDRELSSV